MCFADASLPLPPRLLPSVLKRISRSQHCWTWTGYISTGGTAKGGYGKIRLNNRTYMAHRLVYRIMRGPTPSHLTIDHLCRNRACVNPDHMELVTQAENNHRGNSPFEINRRKTHCNKGHEFTPENTYLDKGIYRRCRKCNAQAVSRYNLRRKP